MQRINFIRWLEDVIKGLGGTTPVVQIKVVRQPDLKRVHISFQVPVRHIDFALMEPGEPIPMVSIAAMGGVAPIWVTYERLAVEACLQQLQDHGYFVPDFSYFRIKQLKTGESNVILTTERLCQLNRQDRDLVDGESTIVAVSFQAILNQVLKNLALTYMGGEPFFTRDFKFKAKLAFYRANQLNMRRMHLSVL